MRKITDLFKPGVRVYLLVRNKNTDKVFRRQAEQEGIEVFGENGLYFFKDNHTLQSVGYVDHICFGSGVSCMGDGTPIVRIDVEKYFSESQDYYYRKN